MRTTILALPLILLLAACGDEPASSAAWKPVDPGAMSTDQKAQQAKGVAAKDALFSRLTGKLKAAFAEGPGAAIGACRVAAPEITAAVGGEQGLRIGRTSHKLRNPKNTPPDWAGAFIDQRTSKPVWLAHDDGRLAGLLPISTMPLCLMCHGEKNSLMEPIRTALHENYPDDQATGFAPGDLRGWFWLEIPKP